MAEIREELDVRKEELGRVMAAPRAQFQVSTKDLDTHARNQEAVIKEIWATHNTTKVSRGELHAVKKLVIRELGN